MKKLLLAQNSIFSLSEDLIDYLLQIIKAKGYPKWIIYCMLAIYVGMSVCREGTTDYCVLFTENFRNLILFTRKSVIKYSDL